MFMNLKNQTIQNQGLNNTQTSMDKSDDEDYNSSEEEYMSDDYQLSGAHNSDDEPSISEEEDLSDDSKSNESNDLENNYSTKVEDDGYITSDDEDEVELEESIRELIAYLMKPKLRKEVKQ